MRTQRFSPAVLALIAAGAGAGAIALQQITEFEGHSLRAYQDGAKVWTICSGHTAGVSPGDTATPADCDAFMASDLAWAFAAVDRSVTVAVPETTRAALASFCFNVGARACSGSTAIRRINAGDRAGGCADLRRWVYAGGKDCRDPANRCRGIVDRREKEATLCLL